MKHVILTHREKSLVPVDEVARRVETLGSYRSFLSTVAESKEYDFPESSICLPFDAGVEETVKSFFSRLKTGKPASLTGGLSYVILIGSGGSALGAYAVYTARYPWVDALTTRSPKLIVLDGLSSSVLTTLFLVLDRGIRTPDELLVFVSTKSGATTETIAQYEVLFAYLHGRFGDVHDRFIFITNTTSPLMEQARLRGISVRETPRLVGGRFSVFSLAHLLPLATVGVDVFSLLEGARAMRARCLDPDPEENPALSTAAMLHYHLEHGVRSHSLFLFDATLAGVGSWYRQLLSESLGKEGKGILPIISTGPQDLHSMAQFFLGGPKDFFTTFVSVNDEPVIRLSRSEIAEHLGLHLSDKSVSEISRTILVGVRDAYERQKLPFVDVVLPDAKERSLGQFLMWHMMMVMYLGKLIGVNAFDQPDVEEYKKETRGYLAR